MSQNTSAYIQEGVYTLKNLTVLLLDLEKTMIEIYIVWALGACHRRRKREGGRGGSSPPPQENLGGKTSPPPPPNVPPDSRGVDPFFGWGGGAKVRKISKFAI